MMVALYSSQRSRDLLATGLFLGLFTLGYGWSFPRPPLQPFARAAVVRRARRSDESWDDPYYEYSDKRVDSRRDSSSRSYWNNEVDYDDDYGEEMYQETPLQKDVLEWEQCPTDAGTAHILLPPLSVQMPSTVIHFTGGTFFGSSPSLWYRQFLQDVVRHTQAAVIATSIPVTLLQSPLQHVTLAKKLQRQFQVAWREILVDEYGEAIQNVPVCGMGHSLGARLLVVLATLGAPPRRRLLLPPDYKAFVLISFTNYGAAAGIPGIYELGKSSRRVERQQADRNEEDEYRSRRQRRRNDWLDDDIDEDGEDDWGEIFRDLQDSMREQAWRVKSALTPTSDKLEFYPSPEQLWRALSEDKRYKIPYTLIVQFDNDEVDQSAKITEAIKHTSDVKFARLRGTHLTPVSVQGNAERNGNAWLQQFNSRVGRLLARVLSGKRQSKEALRSLRQSIASFITELVTQD